MGSLGKFLAPWGGHCKSMKPAYDKLAAEFESSSSVAIVDVDCTKEQDLCSKNGVKGYPTIKYYLDGEAKDYQSGRTYDDMKKFVEENLERKCTVADPKECSDKEKGFIEKMKASLKQWLVQRMHIL